MTNEFSIRVGDPSVLAFHLSSGGEGTPPPDWADGLAWGRLELWADGRCLTLNRAQGDVRTWVEWSLFGLAEWLVGNGERLLNEEPFPIAARRNIADAAEWLDATLDCPHWTDEEEQTWFEVRSAWSERHVFSTATLDMALPDVVWRRLGDLVEISWSNGATASVRADVTFLDQRGVALVDANLAARTLSEFVRRWLGDLSPPAALQAAVSSRRHRLNLPDPWLASDEAWQWLIPAQTAELIRSERPTLHHKLVEHTKVTRLGLYVPHHHATMVLRHVGPVALPELDAILAMMTAPSSPLADELLRLRHPSVARSSSPWRQANDAAEDVRIQLGWGNSRAPSLLTWLQHQGCAVHALATDAPPDLKALTLRQGQTHARAFLRASNPTTARHETALATILGHLLLDVDQSAVDGAYEHWPTAARARAFGIALLLPEAGIRSLLAAHRTITAATVRTIAATFGAGTVATTHRLCNLGYLSPEARDALQHEIASPVDATLQP